MSRKTPQPGPPLVRDRWLLLIALFAAALILRLPGLMDVPRFEDEGDDVLWAWEIAVGRRSWPLTGFDAYYGPLFSYLLAALYKVFGVHVLVARLMVAVFGALTVPAVHVLGRVLFTERAALLASALALASPTMVFFSSHYGWSNSLSPFFATVTLIAIYVGTTARRPGVMAAGGVLAGLTVQTHPLCLVLVPAIAAWYCLAVPLREWLTRREAYAAMAGVVAGYAPMLWSFVTAWDELAQRVANQTYAYAPAHTMAPYVERLPAIALALLTACAGVLWLALPAMLWAWRARRHTPGSAAVPRPARLYLPVVFGVCLLLLPAITPYYPIRYLTFLLPMIFVWVSGVLDGAWEGRFGTAGSPAAGAWWGGRASPAYVTVLIAVAAVDLGVLWLARTQYEVRLGNNNAFYQLRDTLNAREACREGVFLERFDQLDLSPDDGAWTYFNFQAIRLVLTLGACVPEPVTSTELTAQVAGRHGPAWLIVSEPTAAALEAQADIDRVMSVASKPEISPHLRLMLIHATPRQGAPTGTVRR